MRELNGPGAAQPVLCFRQHGARSAQVVAFPSAPASPRPITSPAASMPGRAMSTRACAAI